MEKLQSYKSKVALNFEVTYPCVMVFVCFYFFYCLFSQLFVLMMVQGVQYKLGDFMLRVIKVVPNQAENLRGILMEVTFL